MNVDMPPAHVVRYTNVGWHGASGMSLHASPCLPRRATIRLMILLDDILAATGATLHAPAGASEWTDWCYDSRLARPGELFVAIRTERRDGHDFIADALRAGCTGVVCEQPPEAGGATIIVVPDVREALQRWASTTLRRFGPLVVGVTGSVGKSGTKRAIATLLAGLAPTFASRRSFNSLFGLPLALGRLERQHRFAVLELGVRSLRRNAPPGPTVSAFDCGGHQCRAGAPALFGRRGAYRRRKSRACARSNGRRPGAAQRRRSARGRHGCARSARRAVRRSCRTPGSARGRCACRRRRYAVYGCFRGRSSVRSRQSFDQNPCVHPPSRRAFGLYRPGGDRRCATLRIGHSAGDRTPGAGRAPGRAFDAASRCQRQPAA